MSHPAPVENPTLHKHIERALISVSDKAELETLATFLQRYGVDIVSTGGTSAALRSFDIEVKDISELTDFPEIMDGRVKTLHPNVHGALLGRREDEDHQQAMVEHGIQPIDLVIVNLYPFEATLAKEADEQTCIENIDIGGPSMIRSAAKNHHDVVIITDVNDYAELMQEMEAHDGHTSLDFRKRMAAKAFARTASYDAAISHWFAQQQQIEFPQTVTLSAKRKEILRYGENAEQTAALYTVDDGRIGIANAVQIQGKALSYNNINDSDAALELVAEFSEPACAIIKHANPCGVATADTLLAAYEQALASDPVSAFGGIIACNRRIDKATMEAITKLFVECIIAPAADDEAVALLQAKKNVRLLLTGTMPDPANRALQYKTIAGGLLVQQRDHLIATAGQLQVVSKRQPTDKEIEDLLFAFNVCKHVKSNAIVFARNKATVGIGAGQSSRVDSVKIAARKSCENDTHENRAIGGVVASDAFFPFADGLLLAVEAGITAAIHPGGSIRDEEVIAAADAHDIALVVTGQRHFKH